MNRGVWFIVLAVVVLLVYAPAFRNEFVFDDMMSISTNSDLEKPVLDWLFNKRYFIASREYSYRPLVTLTHIFDRKCGPVFGHTFNILLHMGVGWAMFWLLRRYLSFRAAVIGACLFLVHPAYSEVIYIVTFREDMLCSLALLCTLILGLRGKIYLSGMSFAIALFSKESALPFPLFVAIITILPAFKSLRSLLPTLCLLDGFYALIRFDLLEHYYILHAGPYQWLPVESCVVTGFLRLLFFPVTLSVDHKIPFHPGFWMIWPGMFAAVITLYYSIVLFFKKSMGVVPLAWLIIFITPTLNIFPLPNISAERYLYLPMLFPLGAAGYWIDRWLNSLKIIRTQPKWALVPAGILIVLLGIRTHLRGYDLKDEKTLYLSEIKVNPQNRTMLWALGRLYYFEGKSKESRSYLERALKADPNYYPAMMDMGRVEMEAGNVVTAGRYLEDAVMIAPTDPVALLMLAAYRMYIGDTVGALPLYQDALRLPPTPAMQDQSVLDMLRALRASNSRPSHRESPSPSVRRDTGG